MNKIIIIILLIIISCLLSAENPWLGKDKIAHFSYSAVLTYWNYGLSRDIFENSHQNSLIISINFTALMEVAKELSDNEISKTGWSLHDLAYDFAGIFCGLVLINNLR